MNEKFVKNIVITDISVKSNVMIAKINPKNAFSMLVDGTITAQQPKFTRSIH